MAFLPIWFPVGRDKKECEANKKWKEGCISCTCQPDGKEVVFLSFCFFLSFCLLSRQSYGKQVVCDDLECRDGNSNDYGTFRFPVERRKPQGTQNVFFRSLPKLPLSLSFFVTFSPLWFPVEREKKDCEANKQWKEGCRSCTCQPDGKEVVCHDLECGDGKVVV